MQPLNEFPTDPRTGLDLITIPEDLSRQFEGSGLGSYNAQGVLQDQDAIAAAAARKKHAAATAGRRGHGSSKSGRGKTAQDNADANESTAVDLPGFHWFGKVERMGGADGDIATARMCVVTDESLFLCRLTGGLSFCLKIGRIDEVMISDSGRCLGLRAKTPPAYDLQLRFQNANDAKTVLKIAQRIHWYETGDRVKIREIETGKAAAQAALIFGPGQGPMAAMHRPPSALDLRNQGLSQSRNQSQTFGQNQNQNLGQRQSQQQRASVGGTSSVEGRSLLTSGGGAQSFRENSPDPRMVVSENADFGSDDGRVLSRNSSFTRSKGAPEPPSLLDAARSQAAKTQRRFLMDKAKRVAASREVTEGHLAAIRAELREELEGFRTDEYEHTVDQLASYAAPLAEREQEVTRLRTALAEAKKRETRCPTCEKYMALLASHPLDDRRRIGMLERELRGLQEVMQHARSCLETRDQERRRTERSSAEDDRRMKVLAAETEEERREIIAELDAIESEHDRAVKEERTRRRHEAEEKAYREAKAKEEEHRAQHPGAPSDHFPSSTMAVGGAGHLHGSALLSGDFMTKMAKLEAPVTASKGGVPIGTLKPHGGSNSGGGFDASDRPFSTEQDWRRDGGIPFSPTDHASAVSFEGASGAQQHRRASAASSSGASAGDGDLNDEKQRRRRSTNKQKGNEKGKKDGKEVRRPRMLAELDGPPIPDDLPSLKVELQLEREELLALAQRAARRAEDSFDIDGAKRRALSLEDEIDALKSKLKSAEDDHVAQMRSVKAAFAEYERNAALAASSAELKRSGGLASTFGSVTPALARSPWGKPLDGTTQHQRRSTWNDRDQQQQRRDRAHSTPTTQHRGQSPATSQRYGQAAAQDRAIDLTPSSRRVPAPVTPPALASPSTAHRHDGVEQGRHHPSSGQYGRSGDGVPVPCTPGRPCSDRSAVGSVGVFGGLVPPGFSPSPSHQLSKGRSDLPDGYSTPIRSQVHVPISAAKATTTPMKTPAQPEGAQGYTRRAEGIIHTESPLLTAAMSAPYAPQSKQQSTTPKSTPGALSSTGATPQQSERYQQQYQQQSFKSPTGQFPAACTAAAATATNVTAAAKEESWLGATSAGVPGLDAGEYRHFDKMTSADRQPHQTNGQAAARHHVDARSDQATEFRGGQGPLIAPYGSFGVAPALYGHRTQRTDTGLPKQW